MSYLERTQALIAESKQIWQTVDAYAMHDRFNYLLQIGRGGTKRRNKHKERNMLRIARRALVARFGFRPGDPFKA